LGETDSRAEAYREDPEKDFRSCVTVKAHG
jgi:hypothetical protein